MLAPVEPSTAAGPMTDISTPTLTPDLMTIDRCERTLFRRFTRRPVKY